MMIFNVETHGDIRFCPICRRYIVTIANSPHPVALQPSLIQASGECAHVTLIQCCGTGGQRAKPTVQVIKVKTAN